MVQTPKPTTKFHPTTKMIRIVKIRREILRTIATAKRDPSTTTVMPANVEDTVTTGAAEIRAGTPRASNFFDNTEKKSLFKSGRSLSKEREDEQKRLLKEKRNGLLQDLRNAFKKEADCEVDNVVSSSDRQGSGITSNDVMRLAAEPTMRAKCVMLDADGSRPALITLLRELGAKRKGERNPNVSFLLTNGSLFWMVAKRLKASRCIRRNPAELRFISTIPPSPFPTEKSPMRVRRSSGRGECPREVRRRQRSSPIG